MTRKKLVKNENEEYKLSEEFLQRRNSLKQFKTLAE